MKVAIITGLFLSSALGSIYWFGIYNRTPIEPMLPADHHSSLSQSDYAIGELRAHDAITRMTPRMSSELEDKGLTLGSPVFIRIFKESRELELWVLHQESARYRYFKTWKIAAMSGQLGPKLAEGDFQAPEGFYYVTPANMKPDSRFHLAFNIDFPNQFDIANGRTGSFIMVHGNRLSAGCFAMTDPSIEEIYTLCAKAQENGQSHFRVHSFPFRMTSERLHQEINSPWHDFWMNLKEGYDWFEKNETPPNATVRGKHYAFE